jgi:hypothetical protein
MHPKIKKAATVIPLILLAFSPDGNNTTQADDYYSLKFLKKAAAPIEMKVLKIDNPAVNRSMIERGILITFKSRDAQKVKIAGDFSAWRPIRMEKGRFGVWYYFLNRFKGMGTVRYKFLVDGTWTDDPENPERDDDSSGSYVSIFHAPENRDNRYSSFRMIGKNTVEFLIFNPKAEFVSIVGDFNEWNPENDQLTKNSEGFWKIKKRLYKGKYRYKYIIDGRWSPDMYNKNSASDDFGEICSIIEIK